MCLIMEVNLMDDERLARSLADGMGNDRRVTVIAPLHSSCGPFRVPHFHNSSPPCLITLVTWVWPTQNWEDPHLATVQ